MVTDSVATSDKGIGFAVLFSITAVAGALVLAVAPSSLVAATGFAAAMLFAALAVVAIHVYWR